MISKINKLFLDDDTVYCFDLDGTLGAIEYDEYNHYKYIDDNDWKIMVQKNDYYSQVEPLKIMQDFIKRRNINNIYIITKVMNESELDQKIRFLEKNYHILKDHIYAVYNDEDKVKIMKKIKSQYPLIKEKQLVMVDDSVSVLNNIANNSNFATVHISSFLK